MRQKINNLMARLQSATKRDAFEVFAFDIALIFLGIVTLPMTREMASNLGAEGAWHGLVQALLLFVVRSIARYFWRRYFRMTEASSSTQSKQERKNHGSN